MQYNLKEPAMALLKWFQVKIFGFPLATIGYGSQSLD